MTKEISKRPEQECLTRDMAMQIARRFELTELGQKVSTVSREGVMLSLPPDQRPEKTRKGAQFALLASTIKIWAKEPDLYYRLTTEDEDVYIPIEQKAFAKPRIAKLYDKNRKFINFGVVDIRMENVRAIVQGALEVMQEASADTQEVQRLLDMLPKQEAVRGHTPRPRFDQPPDFPAR